MSIHRAIRILALVALPLACSISDPQTGETLATNFVLDNTTVGQGETIHITVSTGNYGNDPITLSGRGGCYLFFQIREPGRNTIVFFSNTECSGATTTMVLQPGQTHSEDFSWDGRSTAGFRLSSGTYDLHVGANLPGKSLLGAGTLVNVE